MREVDATFKGENGIKYSVLSSSILWLKDSASAIWALATVWFIRDIEKLKRRKLFIETGIDVDRQKQLPLKLWKWCYTKRIQNLIA